MLEVKDKAAAQKFTRMAQALFVVAGGSAVAVAFVGGPKSSASSSASYTPKEVAVNVPGEKAAVDVDLASASARMGLIGNAPRQIPPEPPPKIDNGDGKQPEVATKPDAGGSGSGDVIQYLGPVRLGSKTLALLSIHGKQRFAAMSDATDDGTVTEITSEHVTLTLRDVERKIDRAARSGDVVTRVSGATAARGAVPRVPAMARPAAPMVPQPVAQPMVTPRPIVQDPNVHFDDIRSRLKGTGLYQDDEDLTKAAKQEMERQMMGGKPPEKGPK